MRGLFDPSKYRAFRFTERSLSPDGAVRLVYALDDEHEFVEEFDVPVAPGADLRLAEALHADAHAKCFIARSVNFAVRYEAEIRWPADE